MNYFEMIGREAMYRDFDSLKSVPTINYKNITGKKIFRNELETDLILSLPPIVHFSPFESKYLELISYYRGQNDIGENSEPYDIGENFVKRKFKAFMKTQKKPYVKIIDNTEFGQISNISDLLSQCCEVMMESYDKQVSVNPFHNFAIRLKDEVNPDYKGQGELQFVTGNFPQKRVDRIRNFGPNYFCNMFLEHFIAWNFTADQINDCSMKKLMDMDEKMDKEGNRAGFNSVPSITPRFFPGNITREHNSLHKDLKE